MTTQEHSASPAPTRAEAVTEYLKGEHVAFELIEHAPTMTAAAEGRATHHSPEEVAKTIVLHEDGAYVIAAIPASQRLDLPKVRALLGAGRHLRLADEAEIGRDFPSLEVGAVPPFGPMVPAAEVIDVRLMARARILCPAGDHRHSVLLDPHDVVRITAARVADISED